METGDDGRVKRLSGSKIKSMIKPHAVASDRDAQLMRSLLTVLHDLMTMLKLVAGIAGHGHAATDGDSFNVLVSLKCTRCHCMQRLRGS